MDAEGHNESEASTVVGTHIDGEPEEFPSWARTQGVIEDGSMDEFFRTAEGPLLRYLAGRGVPKADAEDLLIEAAIVIGEQWGRLESPFAYACTVALNGWRSLLSQDKRLRALFPRLVGPEVAEDERLSRWEQAEGMEQLLGRLSPIQRAVVTGRQEGYTTEELSARLGVPRAAVRRHLHDGYARLRKVVRPSSPAAVGASGGPAAVTRPDQKRARDEVERDGLEEGGHPDE